MVKVSVCIQTYNHKPFIAQALDSVLMQETGFDYEIILGEDESQDGTRAMCIEYARRYPDRIRLFLRSRKDVIYINGRPTGRFNFVENLKAARGEYIALLEGDDYWTDPHKLQKQVDFLDSHPEYPICFHPVFWLEQDTSMMHLTYYGAPGIKEYYTLDDLLEYSNFIPTASVVFRNFIVKEYPDWFYQAPIGDYPLHILNLCYSGCEKIGFIDEPMAVYRRHSGGVYSGRTRLQDSQSLINVHFLIGANLGLERRISWRTGMSREYVKLCRAYKAEGKQGRALVASHGAVHYAPQHLKKQVLWQLVPIMVPGAGWLLYLARKSASLIRHEGIRAFIKAVARRFGGAGVSPPHLQRRKQERDLE